ncbi:MAG: sulfite exporter TauE/SafE family protein [Planctomycetes bacterium]|nr:sulfite exporter TauE/SafE family protein [Planctomycetota bacterium]
MEFTLNITIGSVVIGFVVGMLTGVFGVGGGFLMTPALMIILNIPGPMAVGTDLATILATSSFGMFRRRGSNTVDVKLAIVISIGSILGVLTGSHFLELLKYAPKLIIFGKEQEAVPYYLLCMFLFLLTWIAGFMTFDYLRNGQRVLDKRVGIFARLKIPPYLDFTSLEQQHLPIVMLLFLGFFVGVLTGFMGIGGGVLLLPSLIYLVGQRTNKAIGTSLLLVWISSLIAVIRKSEAGDINLLLLAFLLAGGLTGTFIGTKIGLKLADPKIRLYFVYVVIVGVLMVGYELYVITF